MSVTAAATWKATDSGEVEGYLSVWNLVDAEDDVVEPGAFRDVIKAWHLSGERLPLVVDHDPNAEVGQIVELEEDAVGVKFRARFDSSPRAQQARHRALLGDVRGISYGYQADRRSGWLRDKAVQIIERVRLLSEVTLSLMSRPINPLAQLTLAKAGAGWPSMPLPAASRVVTEAQGIALERRRRGNDLEWNELQRKAAALEQSWVGPDLVERLGVERCYDELLAPTIAAAWRRQQEPGWVDPEQAKAAARARALAEADWRRDFAEIQERAARPCGHCRGCRHELGRCDYQ